MTTREEFTDEINKEIAKYRRNRSIHHRNALVNLKENITNMIKAFIPEDAKAKAVDKEIASLADDLVNTARSFYAKYRIVRWIESVINYALGKKEAIIEQVEAAPEMVASRLNFSIPSAFKDLPIEERLYIKGKAYLAEIAKYDLLDNIVDIEKIKRLNGEDLELLHKFVMLEVGINGLDVNHSKSIGRIHDQIIAKHMFDREEMLNNLNFVLDDYKQFNHRDCINSDEIRSLKRLKIDGVIAVYALEIEGGKVTSSPVGEVMQAMKDKTYALWIKDIAQDVMESAESNKSGKLSESALITQLQEHQEFIEENINGKATENFYNKLKDNLQDDCKQNDYEHQGLVSSTLREMFPSTYKFPVAKEKMLQEAPRANLSEADLKELEGRGCLGV